MKTVLAVYTTIFLVFETKVYAGLTVNNSPRFEMHVFRIRLEKIFKSLGKSL